MANKKGSSMNYFRKDLYQKHDIEVSVPHRKIMMCLNESTLNPFIQLREDFLTQLEKVPVNRYFNNITTELSTELSSFAGVPENHLAFGNGADEMLYFIFLAVRDSADSYAVALSPSYFDYKTYSHSVDLKIKLVDLDEHFGFSYHKYMKTCNNPNCKLAILCNPNNPTGNLFDKETLLRIIKSSKRLVLLDETYYEFSGISLMDHIHTFDNLVIVRSFSKSFSAAGLRFGYMISQPQNIKQIKKVMTYFHMNLITQAFATSMLKNKSIFLEHNQKVIQMRDNMCIELSKINGIKVYSSSTNFLIFSAGDKSKPLFQYLLDNDIAIRPVWNHQLLKNCLRVTISSSEDNALFLQKVKEFFNKDIMIK